MLCGISMMQKFCSCCVDRKNSVNNNNNDDNYCYRHKLRLSVQNIINVSAYLTVIIRIGNIKTTELLESEHQLLSFLWYAKCEK